MIHVYNTDFEYQGEVDAFESLMWVRRWSKAGDFQIVLNAHTFGIEKLVKGHIITISPDKTGIIAHIEEDTSESGKANDQILVRGLDLKGLIGKRITVPPVGLSHDALTANVETIMKRYVDVNAVSTNPERIIPNLSIAPDKLRGPSFYYQTRHQELHEELEKLSLASNLGWDVLFTGKGYVFDTPSGSDLSILQSVNSPVIFGVEFDNVGGQKIVTSNLDYRNVAIVAGQGEGAEREVIVIGEASGLDRNEVFIDARDIEDGANLPDRGRQKLFEYTKVDSFETEILTDGPFVYKKDWDLGDIVTIQNAKKTRTVHERIVEVTETHEKGSGFQLRAVFGNALPTLIEKIKRELDEPDFNDGRDGESGPVGEAGPRGPQGLPGPKGDTGERGPQGLKGDIGLTGAAGPQGERGLKGDTGLQGPKGDMGPVGPKGDTGLQGVKGATGAAGPKGDAGYTPVKGIDYYDGATGAKGDTGLRGLQGVQGIQGVKGDTGPIGLTGPKGDKGDTGAQGPPGATVADSVEWLNVLNKPSNLETTAGAQTKATSAQNAAVNHANSLTGNRIVDSRAVVPKPSDYAANRTTNEFKLATSVGLGGVAGAYVHVFTERAWSDPSGGYVHQLAYDGLTARIWTRYGNQSTEVWGAWEQIETTSGSQDKVDNFKPFHIGATPPSNKNLIWYDTN